MNGELDRQGERESPSPALLTQHPCGHLTQEYEITSSYYLDRKASFVNGLAVELGLPRTLSLI